MTLFPIEHEAVMSEALDHSFHVLLSPQQGAPSHEDVIKIGGRYNSQHPKMGYEGNQNFGEHSWCQGKSELDCSVLIKNTFVAKAEDTSVGLE